MICQKGGVKRPLVRSHKISATASLQRHPVPKQVQGISGLQTFRTALSIGSRSHRAAYRKRRFRNTCFVEVILYSPELGQRLVRATWFAPALKLSLLHTLFGLGPHHASC